MPKSPKLKPPKISRNKADNGDVVELTDKLRLVVEDDGTVLIGHVGKRSAIDWHQNREGTPSLPPTALIRIRFTDPAPLAEREGGTIDPTEGRPSEEEMTPDA